MGQTIVLDLDDDVIAARDSARHSLEQQLRDALTEAAEPTRGELIADLRRIRAMTPPEARISSETSSARMGTVGEARAACMIWDPERYLAFGDHRTRPAKDLLARVTLAAPARVADLGCGPGNSTALLAARWPEADVLGVDSSSAMLAEARASGLRASWAEADIALWTPAAPFDVVFANAVLQWLPDHATLLPRLLGQVRPGGVLAVQMPRNFEAPSHVLLRAVADAGPWADRLRPLLPPEPVGEPAWYYDLLAPRAAAIDVWETEYLQVLEGEDPVLAWTGSTALRPVQAALAAHELRAFEEEYKRRLRAAYPRRPDGRTLFPFRRLFIVACRSD